MFKDTAPVFDHEMSTIRLRFLVEDPDALFKECRARGVECCQPGIGDTPWETREYEGRHVTLRSG